MKGIYTFAAVAAVFVLGGYFRTIVTFVFWKEERIPRNVKRRRGALKAHEREYLSKYNSYYEGLTPALKDYFEKRIIYFINRNKFIPRGYTHINEEMQVLIASAAVQLTFGFKAMHFPHFWRILVYQDDYYSKITQKYHQGEVHPKGFIVLSWRNILKGFQNASDGRNLALHEMAHALHLENSIRNREFGFFSDAVWSRFQALASEEMAKIKRGQSILFRSYAQVNFHEFFAVCIEQFFERPDRFFKESAELYELMTKLLQQDPRNVEISLPYKEHSI